MKSLSLSLSLAIFSERPPDRRATYSRPQNYVFDIGESDSEAAVDLVLRLAPPATVIA